jgi:hypothetical protein
VSDEAATTTRRIISQAVSDLTTHAAKLEVVHGRVRGELDEAKAFIKAVEKVFGKPEAPQETRAQRRIGEIVRDAAAPRPSPRSRFTDKIIALVADDGRSVESIANQFGASLDFTRSCVEQAVRRGQLQLVDGAVRAVQA